MYGHLHNTGNGATNGSGGNYTNDRVVLDFNPLWKDRDGQLVIKGVSVGITAAGRLANPIPEYPVINMRSSEERVANNVWTCIKERRAGHLYFICRHSTDTYLLGM